MNGYAILDAALQRATFEVLFCAQAAHDATWRERGRKASCDFWIIQQGSLRITYKRKIYTLTAGDVFFIEPGVFYSAVSGAHGCSFYFAHFRAQLEENTNVFSGFSLGGKTEAEAVRAEVQSFKTAYAGVTSEAPMAQFALKAAMMQLCARMVMLREAKQAPLPRLEQVLQYINAHLEQSPTVSELAAQMRMSEKYFISYFKKHMGQTPHAYMIEQKMQRAYAALYPSDAQVKAVAQSLGYCDAYAFSKAFKTHYGIAPSLLHKNTEKPKKKIV